MARGTLVGDAYVRIHADSDAMARELRRQARKAGNDAGETAGANWLKGINGLRGSELKRVNERLMKGVVGGKPEWDRQFRQSGLASVRDFVSAAEQSFNRLAKEAQKAGAGGSLKELRRNLEDLDRWARDALAEEALKNQMKLGRELAKDVEARLKNERKLQEALGASIVRDMKKQEQAARKLQEALGGSIVRDMQKQKKAIADADRALRKYQEALGGSIVADMKRHEKAVLDQDRAFQSYSDNIGRRLPNALQRLAAAFDRENSMKRYAERVNTTIPRALLRLNRHLDSSESHFTRFSTIIGKVFGKGSRNDFLNFVGSVVGGLARVGTGLAHAGLRIVGFGATFSHVLGVGLVNTLKGIGSLFTGGGFADIGSALKGIGKGMGDLAIEIGVTLAGGLKTAIPLAIALVAAFSLMSVVIFPLIALVANLAGAIFVLASEIAVALAGGLLALAPAVLAFAGGIGVAIGFIAKLKNATDKQKKAMKPLTTAWDNFTKIFEGPLLDNFIKSLNNLAPLIKTVLTPTVKNFARAIGIVTDSFTALLTGPRLQGDLKKFAEVLPRIFTNFGQGFGELTAGLIEFFEPILPFAEKLSEKFEELMTTFNDWASSAEGKNSIKEFMENAWEAASDLWDIINLAAEALGGLIGVATGDTDEGKGTTVLDSIKTKLQEFVDWIESPQGKQAITDFFTNARDTAAALGTAIGELATALQKVDWDAASETANNFIILLGQVTAAIVVLTSSNGTQLGIMSTAWLLFGRFMNDVLWQDILAPVFALILRGLIGIITGMGAVFDLLGKAIPGNDPFEQMSDSIDLAVQKLDGIVYDLQHIPDADATVHIGLSGPGARLLQQQMMNRRPISGVELAAAGGILDGPTFIRSHVLAGEAGREAVVPLDRPLSLIDPSVREIAAFAQGLPTRKMASGGVLGGGATVMPGAITVISPNADPAMVAESVFDRLVVNVR